jgi:hypothetical protein
MTPVVVFYKFIIKTHCSQVEYLRLGLHVHVGQPCLSKTLPKGQWIIHTGPQIGLIGMAKKEAN